MADKEEKTINREETRTFKYSNAVTFEFEVEVSEPNAAIAEITDFMELLEKAKSDLTKLRDTFQKQIGPKEKEEKSVAVDKSAPAKSN